VIAVRAIAQEHVSQRPPVLVLAVGLERHVLTKDQLRDGLLRPLAVSLALLRAVDAPETDALSAVIVQDFDGVAVEDGDDGAGELIGKRTCSRKQRQ
jgi:hypothetical protein